MSVLFVDVKQKLRYLAVNLLHTLTYCISHNVYMTLCLLLIYMYINTNNEKHVYKLLTVSAL